jgi:hypothetical protein
MTRAVRLRRIESVAREFRSDPERWLRLQPDAVLEALIARGLAGKTIAGFEFPEDPDTLKPSEINAMLTDEVLQALANGIEGTDVH